MAYDDYDLTAPYRGAVDATSRYLIPAAENSPQGLVGRALRKGAGNLYSQHLRAPLQRGGQMMSQALQGVPPIGPLGMAKDAAGLMAGLNDPAAAPPSAPPAAPAPTPPAAPPMAMGAPAPAPMAAPSPAAPRSPSPAGSLAAPPTPSPEPRPGTAPDASGATPTPSGMSQAPSPEDAALRQQQKALDDYYTGVVGTGAGQRKADRMFALSNSLRGGGGGRDWASQLAEGVTGAARGYGIYKGLQGENEREAKLDELRQQYLRSRGGGGGEGPVY